MYRLRIHIAVIGLMIGMMADYFGQNTVAAVSLLTTYMLLHVV